MFLSRTMIQVCQHCGGEGVAQEKGMLKDVNNIREISFDKGKTWRFLHIRCADSIVDSVNAGGK